MQSRQRGGAGVVIISVLAGIIIGYLLAEYIVTDNRVDEINQEINQELQENSDSDRGEGEVDSELVEGNANDTAFTIAVSNLDPTQEAAARAAGVEGDTIVVTNGMVVCAEGEVGADRLVEIQNGARLTVNEGLTFIGCYRDNR